MTASTKWWWLGIFVVTGSLLYILAPVLTPFMVAAVLAYIGDPLVDKLETCKFPKTKWTLPRSVAVSVVFVGLTSIATAILIILLPMFERQMGVLLASLPKYLDLIQESVVPWLSTQMGIEFENIDAATVQTTLLANWQSAGGIANNIIQSITRSGMTLLAWAANIGLIIVVTFYLLRDWDGLIANIRGLLPRKNEAVIVELTRQSDQVISAFFRGQLLVMAALALVYSVGLSIIGLDVAILIGLLAGVVSFVPYLGFIVGILVAGIAAGLQFQDVDHLFYVLIVFGVGQALEGMLLTPLLVGDKIGLHPVAVIFAVLAGGQLFGFFGILLALPVAAVIMVILRYIHDRYKDSHLYQIPEATSD